MGVMVPGNFDYHVSPLEERAAGDYALKREDGESRLYRGNLLVMADTVWDWLDMKPYVEAAVDAGGWSLQTGLGIGMYLNAVLRLSDATRVTAVEKSSEVISMVAPAYEHWGDRLEIVHADAWTWTPTRRYSVGWHDIWLDRAPPDERDRLMARFASHCAKQGAWK